jgi:hypothetical protein
MPSACPRCGNPVATSARRCPSCDKVLRSPIQLETPRPAELPPITRPRQRPGPQTGPQTGVSGQPPRTTAEIRTEAAVEKTRAGVRFGVRLFRKLPRRARFALIGVIVLLVVGVPTGLWVVGKVAYAPEEPVEELVSAFDDRDYARVAELAGCTARLCRSGSLGEGYTPPANLEIAKVAPGGSSNPDSADVVLRYELAGERRESVVRVRRGSGVLPKSWSIVSGLVGQLEIVAPSVKSVRIAALEIDPKAGGREPALIGAYQVRVSGEDPLYQSEPVLATISGDLRSRPSTSVNLTTAVRQSARDDVSNQVKAFLDQCVAQAEIKPRVNGRPCPMSAKQTVPFSSGFTWQLDPAPVFEVVVPAKPREGVVLEVRTTTPGRATFRYTFDGEQYSYDPVTVEVKGEVHLVDGKPQFVAI